MKSLDKVFKAYDIRGEYPNDLNEEITYLAGVSFVSFLKGEKKKNIVVAKDNRVSSPKLKKALVKGITDAGANVIDIGDCMTPMMYFAVSYYNFDGGMMITASHNPPQYNGIKIVKENSFPISGASGLEEIKKIALKMKLPLKNKKGAVIKKNIVKDYIDFNIQNDFKPGLNVVIDTANAIPGKIAPLMLKGVNLFHIFAELDGRFPNHNPNPVEEENMKWIKKEVIKRKADLGIAFDGDGDRIIFVDEKGDIVPGEFITALMAKILLRERKGLKISYDICSSNVVKEVIEEFGGKPIMTKVGHSFIKEQMRKENIFFGGEITGHYYSKEHFFCDVPFFVIFKIFGEISRTGKNLSLLLKPFKKYFYQGGINLKIEDKEQKIKALEQYFKKGKKTYLDGLRIDFDDWWFIARLSHTEPLLRLVIEAKTRNILTQRKKEILSLLKK